jgi:AcrR family transcriptional regulator
MLDKKEQILETTRGLFLTEGLMVPTLRIAKIAGVANGTLFNYFPTKQDLIDAIYLTAKQEVLGLFSSNGLGGVMKLEEGFSLVWNSYTRWALKFPQKHDVMNLLKTARVVSPQVIKQTESSLEPLYKLVQKSMAGGEIRKIDIDYLYQILRAQIDASIAHALKKGLAGLPLEKHIQNGFEIFWKSIRV